MNKHYIKFVLLGCCSFVLARTCADIIASGNVDNIGGMLCNIKETSFRGMYKLIFYGSYVAGFAVIGTAIFKLKQVKDNPTQIPVSTPIALFVCGTLLMLLPSIIGTTGVTLFGSNNTGNTAYTITGSSNGNAVISDQSSSINIGNLLESS